MMSGHGADPILLNKKINTGHPEHSLTPHPLRPTTSHFTLPFHTCPTPIEVDVICVSPLINHNWIII